MLIYDRTKTPMPAPELRLLPWTTDSGKPCYLNGNADSTMAMYADAVEENRLEHGHDALKRAVQVIDTAEGEDTEQTKALKVAAVALSNCLRVADSRGARLPGYEHAEISCGARLHDDDDGNGPLSPPNPSAELHRSQSSPSQFPSHSPPSGLVQQRPAPTQQRPRPAPANGPERARTTPSPPRTDLESE
ncbi:hypothetical protein [Streptomyces sp. AA1529]|uniref:hypothetical protein n=1 Tax=Streptomyces sp. AA1529 TaxID=1203257 RepID=UPI003D760210